ncbi:hypothetical protein QTP88_024702 [Uroleucon formosanum]
MANKDLNKLHYRHHHRKNTLHNNNGLATITARLTAYGTNRVRPFWGCVKKVLPRSARRVSGTREFPEMRTNMKAKLSSYRSRTKQRRRSKRRLRLPNWTALKRTSNYHYIFYTF